MKHHPLYKIKSPKAWFLHDRPDSRKYLSSEEDKVHRESLLFHIRKGDYFSTLATVLRFFEEALSKKDMDQKMLEINLKTVGIIMSDLMYLNDNFDLVPKNK